MALEPGISRLRVAALLWPDSSDPRRNLRQQLLRFRQQFGQALVQGDTNLALSALELEAPTAAPLLAGLDCEDCEPFGTWLQARRRERRDSQARALDEALSHAEAEQRYADAIALAEQLRASAPEAEAHHRTLIRLHYLNHDTARARASCRR